jgi:hypothetical protein
MIVVKVEPVERPVTFTPPRSIEELLDLHRRIARRMGLKVVK